MNRFMIAGERSGSGKTTITIAIMRALVNRGLSVAPFKVGPDYIDAAFHQVVTRTKSGNLDSYLLSPDILTFLFERRAQRADTAVIEGVMGLYDGFDAVASSAHVSKILNTPIVLVLDGKGIGDSIAAMALGYKTLDPDVTISGIIINRPSSHVHYAALKNAVESATGIPVLGCMPRHDSARLESRHLGLVPAQEQHLIEEKADRLAQLAQSHIDLNALTRLTSPPLRPTPPKLPNIDYRGKKIAVALDKAFNFYYNDNLDLLTMLGAELIFFSPLDDALPPTASAIYIGGGFPEVFAAQLEYNRPMRAAIKSAVNNGLPIYAEGGGLMYMCKELVDLEGNRREMCGVIPAASVMTEGLQNFGYKQVILRHNTALGKAGTRFRAHEYHRSRIDGPAGDALELRRRDKQSVDGYIVNKTLAAYPHIHFWSAL